MQRLGATDCDGVRNAAAPVIAFSPAMTADLDELRAFLFAEVYRSERVMTVMRQAEGMVAELFARYLAEPSCLPAGWRADIEALPEAERGPRIVDFVAGMTDRYAIEEHRRLFAQTPELV